jgi:hypothetical protein
MGGAMRGGTVRGRGGLRLGGTVMGWVGRVTEKKPRNVVKEKQIRRRFFFVVGSVARTHIFQSGRANTAIMFIPATHVSSIHSSFFLYFNSRSLGHFHNFFLYKITTIKKRRHQQIRNSANISIADYFKQITHLNENTKKKKKNWHEWRS